MALTKLRPTVTASAARAFVTARLYCGSATAEPKINTFLAHITPQRGERIFYNVYMDKDQGVTVAASAGFCPGVKGAIDKVLELEAAGKKPIYTLGPLIHNKQVTDMLAAKQISSVDKPEQAADKSGVLVIRAHGITPAFRAEVLQSGMEVVDATCPLVKHAHEVISKYAAQGYHTVIVGDGGHAEVIGLLGCSQGKGVVVSGPEEAQKLPAFDKVNVVAQTTQKESVFFATAEVIKQKAAVCQISNTICHPTKLRQSETMKMAQNADLVIVVGGKHSANTARLALLCRELAPQVLHIETEAELTPAQVLLPKRIFITAGASTPNWVINQVADWVRQTRKSRGRSWTALLHRAWGKLVSNNIYSACAAAALTYVCMKLEGLHAQALPLLFSWLFVFSLTTVNRALEDKSRAAHRWTAGGGWLAAAAGLAVAAVLGLQAFLLAALFMGAGLLYPFRHFVKSKILSLPGTKDFFTALGWGFSCALLPALVNGMMLRKASYLAVFYAVLLVFTRSVTLGFASANKDLMIGKESFYKAFGIGKTKLAVAVLLTALTAVLVTLWLITWKPALVAMLLLGHMYTLFIVIYYYRHPASRGIKEETLIDAQFFVLWMLACLSRLI